MTTHDSTDTAIFFVPPSSTSSPSSSSCQGICSVPSIKFSGNSVLQIAGNSQRSSLDCSVYATRSFFYLGLPPKLGWRYLESWKSIGYPPAPLSAQLQLLSLAGSRSSTFIVESNVFVSRSTIDSSGVESQLLILQTQSFLFFALYTQVSLVGPASEFVFTQNQVSLSGKVLAHVMHLTSEPPKPVGKTGAVWTEEEVFPAPAVLSLSDGALFEISSSQITLDSYAEGIRSYGSASVFHVAVADFATQLKHNRNRTLEVSGQGTKLSIYSIELNVHQGGSYFAFSGVGATFSTYMGFSSVTNGGRIETHSSNLTLTCPQDSFTESFPGCNSNPPRSALQLLPSVPTCTAYSSWTSILLEHGGTISFKDENVTIWGRKAQLFASTMNTRLDSSDGSKTASEFTLVEMYARYPGNYTTALEVAPRIVSLIASYRCQAIMMKYGRLKLNKSPIVGSDVSVYLNFGSRRRSSWFLGSVPFVNSGSQTKSPEPTGLMESDSLFWNNFGGVMEFWSYGASINVTAARNIKPLLFDNIYSFTGLPFIITSRASVAIFVNPTDSERMEDAVTNGGTAADANLRPDIIFNAVGFDQPLNVVYFGDAVFTYFFSQLKMLIGVNVQCLGPNPGAGVFFSGQVRVETSSNVIIGDLDITTNTPKEVGVAAILMMNDALLITESALISISNVKAVGFSLYTVTGDESDKESLIQITKNSTFMFANTAVEPVRGTINPAAVILGVPIQMTHRSQLLLWSITAANGTTLMRVGTDAPFTVTNQSSIMMRRNAVSGYALVTNSEWTFDETSAFSFSENILTNNSNPPLLAEYTAVFKAANPFVARCNYYVNYLKQVKEFSPGGLTQGSAWRKEGAPGVHAIPCSEGCDLQLNNASIPIYCSPIGLPPPPNPEAEEDYSALNFVGVDPEPDFPPNHLALATSFTKENLRSCSCLRCNSSGPRQALYSRTLESPFCAPELPLGWANVTFQLPDPTSKPIEGPNSSLDDTLPFIITGSTAGTIFVVALAGAVVYNKKQKKEHTAELKEYTERLLEQETRAQKMISEANLAAQELTEWPVKPTALTFRKGKCIGSGAFGRVYIGLDDESGRLLAAKEISLADETDKDKKMQLLGREIGLMKKLTHKNVVQYLGADQWGETEFMIFMEYLPGGSLRSVITNFGSLNQKLAAQYTKQALKGLAYLHEQRIVHRDLKAANMLLDRNGVLKLADMGCAQNFETVQSMRGTPLWMAPEVVRHSAPGEMGKIGAPADVWSIGCVVIEMLTGKNPFEWISKNPFTIMNSICRGQDFLDSVWESAPVELREQEVGFDFIKLCCSSEPEKRYTAEQLLTTPFIAAASTPANENHTDDGGSMQSSSDPTKTGVSSTYGVNSLVAFSSGRNTRRSSTNIGVSSIGKTAKRAARSESGLDPQVNHSLNTIPPELGDEEGGMTGTLDGTGGGSYEAPTLDSTASMSPFGALGAEEDCQHSVMKTGQAFLLGSVTGDMASKNQSTLEDNSIFALGGQSIQERDRESTFNTMLLSMKNNILSATKESGRQGEAVDLNRFDDGGPVDEDSIFADMQKKSEFQKLN